MPEQLVSAVDQMDVQRATPSQPYRIFGISINPDDVGRADDTSATDGLFPVSAVFPRTASNSLANRSPIETAAVQAARCNAHSRAHLPRAATRRLSIACEPGEGPIEFVQLVLKFVHLRLLGSKLSFGVDLSWAALLLRVRQGVIV
jgi:hypothetical protein